MLVGIQYKCWWGFINVGGDLQTSEWIYNVDGNI